MSFNNIQIKNFRNIENINIDLNPNINIFLGNNGSGKTNLLDSLFYISLATSHKNIKNKNIIKYGNDFAIIKVNNDGTNYKIVISENNKSVFVEENEINKISDFIGYNKTILFTPDDLLIFKGSPGDRRKFINQELSKIDPNYLYNLQVYEKLLKTRNTALKTTKDQKILKVYIDSIDINLASAAANIMIMRNQFINDINIQLNDEFKKIVNFECKTELLYNSSFNLKTANFDLLKKEIKYILDKNFEKDLLTKQTNYGPHRDDITGKFNDELVSINASQGELRAFIITIKLIIADIIFKRTGIKPIIMLDDIFNELDKNKLISFTKILNELDNQIIITATKIDNDIFDLNKTTKFTLKEGQII
jgi:DNA replication and repair protein RecF